MTTKFRISVTAAVCIAGLFGCSGDTGPKRYKVTGTVTLNGTLLDQGRIAFKAHDGSTTTYADDIKGGKFSFQSTPGKKKVEITSLRKVEGKQYRIGGNPGDPISEDNPADIFEEAIPANYNQATQLEAEVKSSGANEYTFALEAKK